MKLVKAFTSTLISWQKYSVYWFIHTIREIALLDIKSLWEQLDPSETLTRVRSTGELFNDSNSQHERKFNRDIKREIHYKIWGFWAKLSRGESQLHNKWGWPSYCLFTTSLTAVTQAAVVLASGIAMWEQSNLNKPAGRNYTPSYLKV